MADNTTLDAGTGGDVIRDLDRAGVKTQIVALDLNPGGSETLMGGAMPVTDNSGSLTVDNGGTFAVQDSQVVADNAAFTDGTTKVRMAGFVLDETAGTALTENDAGAARMDSKRAQVFTLEDATTRGRRATVSSGGALSVDGSGATQPISAASLPLPSGAATSAKQPALGTAGSASSDVITVQGVASMTALKVDGSAVTQPVSGTVTANAGTGTFTVDGSGHTQPVSGTVTANAGTGTMATKDTPQTSGGYSAAVNVDIDETEDAVKTSAGQVYGWMLYNDGASEVYVKLYNDTVANVVVGTTAPLVTLPIPAGSAANAFLPAGVAFSAAITIAATTGPTTGDTGAPATNQVVGTIFYA